MKRKSRTVPEFQVRKRITRAGFVEGRETEVELWQVWCRNSEDHDKAHRATFSDMRRAGFKRRK